MGATPRGEHARRRAITAIGEPWDSEICVANSNVPLRPWADRHRRRQAVGFAVKGLDDSAFRAMAIAASSQFRQVDQQSLQLGDSHLHVIHVFIERHSGCRAIRPPAKIKS
jgi:hypothetical protein